MRTRPLNSPWTPVAIYTVILLVASIIPSPLKRHPEWKYVGPDKFLHLVGHAGYAVILADTVGASRCTNQEAAIFAVCTSTLLSLVTGRLQKWVPGRAFESADVVAGLIGSILAASGWYLVNDTRTRD